MAGRQSKDMREQVLLRALKASRALVVVDDWHCLSASAQRDLAQLICRFPPGPVLTSRPYVSICRMCQLYVSA